MAWTKKTYPNMSRKGNSNGRWVDGSSQTHYRNKINAKDKQIVHHIDGNKKNNTKSNLEVMTRANHNKDHPEKGGNRKCKNGYIWNKKIKSCVNIKN